VHLVAGDRRADPEQPGLFEGRSCGQDARPPLIAPSQESFRHSRESGNPGSQAQFSVALDSRFRGNDSGEWDFAA
jgi:hypothetical protein